MRERSEAGSLYICENSLYCWRCLRLGLGLG